MFNAPVPADITAAIQTCEEAADMIAVAMREGIESMSILMRAFSATDTEVLELAGRSNDEAVKTMLAYYNADVESLDPINQQLTAYRTQAARYIG